MVFYEQEGRRYQADLVILAFFMGNDMQDDYPPLAQRRIFGDMRREQFYRLNAQGQLEPLTERVQEQLASGVDQPASGSLVGRLDGWLFEHPVKRHAGRRIGRITERRGHEMLVRIAKG